MSLRTHTLTDDNGSDCFPNKIVKLCISSYPPAWFTLATSSLNSERIDYLLLLLCIMIAILKNEVNSFNENKLEFLY